MFAQWYGIKENAQNFFLPNSGTVSVSVIELHNLGSAANGATPSRFTNRCSSTAYLMPDSHYKTDRYTYYSVISY
jgi:hypothetical protein